MSKVKRAIETALENINNASRNMWGAKVYTFDQVAMILQDLLKTVSEDDAGGTVLTPQMIGELVNRIEEQIDENINGLSDTDILDSDSLDITISGGRATIDSIDVDKDGIISEANYGIGTVIVDWAEAHGMTMDN